MPTTFVPNATGRPDIIPEAADARERLLKAALQLFSERGFDATGVRDLANAAGVNLGAVNYYFDSKENLRLEAFRYGFAPALQMRKDTQNYLDEAQRKSSIPAAEEALRKYIRRFLDDILAVNSGNWSLLMRELTMPSPAFEIVVNEYFEPQNAILIGILRLLLPRADETTLDCCVGSIMGQCYEVRNTAPIVRSTRGIDTSGADYVKRRADHITDFSLLALRGLRQGHPKARRRS